MLFNPPLIAFLVGLVVSAIGVLLLVLRQRMRHQQLEAPAYRGRLRLSQSSPSHHFLTVTA
jgi:predicted permease